MTKHAKDIINIVKEKIKDHHFKEQEQEIVLENIQKEITQCFVRPYMGEYLDNKTKDDLANIIVKNLNITKWCFQTHVSFDNTKEHLEKLKLELNIFIDSLYISESPPAIYSSYS